MSKANPFGSKLKGKLSPLSYPIQCERNWKYSFLSIAHDVFRLLFQSILDSTDQSFTSPLPILPDPHDNFREASFSNNINLIRKNKPSKDGDSGQKFDYTTALTLTVAIGLSLLVLNIILFGILLYRREKKHQRTKTSYDNLSVQPLCNTDRTVRSSLGCITVDKFQGDSSAICSRSNMQITELDAFKTPPDIGDRNNEVTVCLYLKNNNI